MLPAENALRNIELEEYFDKTRFCGVWLYNNPADNCIAVAPDTFNNIKQNYTHLLPYDEQVRKMQAWVKQYHTRQIAVYCNSCERGIRLGGKSPTYMVELIAENL